MARTPGRSPVRCGSARSRSTSGGAPGRPAARRALASKGAGGNPCKLDEDADRAAARRAGRQPAAYGWAQDQRWTLARVAALVCACSASPTRCAGCRSCCTGSGSPRKSRRLGPRSAVEGAEAFDLGLVCGDDPAVGGGRLAGREIQPRLSHPNRVAAGIPISRARAASHHWPGPRLPRSVRWSWSSPGRRPRRRISCWISPSWKRSCRRGVRKPSAASRPAIAAFSSPSPARALIAAPAPGSTTADRPWPRGG